MRTRTMNIELVFTADCEHEDYTAGCLKCIDYRRKAREVEGIMHEIDYDSRDKSTLIQVTIDGEKV